VAVYRHVFKNIIVISYSLYYGVKVTAGTELNFDSKKVISSSSVHKFRICQVTLAPSDNNIKMKTFILQEILYGIWVDNKCQSYTVKKSC
jgi:hypothetical protein